MKVAKNELVRYTDGTRINHWFGAVLFICAALSGLAFFTPFFFPLTNLFGGGQWTRILHPFFGVVAALSFLGMFIRLHHENRMDQSDREWLEATPKLIAGHEDAMPPVGRNNAGQKLVFWVMAFGLLVLIITGFMFWQPWFAGLFPIPLIRFAALIHSIAAFLVIITLIVHIYAGIWVKGSMHAMIRGTVTKAWARTHHPLWWREEVEQRRKQ
ncbi:formate dehydrogenase subunit gamma [soil metagenome]